MYLYAPFGRPALSGFASRGPASFLVHEIESVPADQQKEKVEKEVLLPVQAANHTSAAAGQLLPGAGQGYANIGREDHHQPQRKHHAVFPERVKQKKRYNQNF
ncbi:hypothetical protein FQZ97_1246570 [compost metagenome]